MEEVAEAAQLATSGGLLEQDLSSRIEIHVRLGGLKKRYNPCCIIYTRRAQDTAWTEVFLPN